MSNPFPVEVVDGREHAIAFLRQPEPIRITAREVGELMANSFADDQAELLLQWHLAVTAYGRTESWPMQCRFIAEVLSDELCGDIRRMLEALVGHLEAIPRERRAAAMTDNIVMPVREAIASPASAGAEGTGGEA
jgi:hypothetical protein